MVERNLPKVDVAGSSPVIRSKGLLRQAFYNIGALWERELLSIAKLRDCMNGADRSATNRIRCFTWIEYTTKRMFTWQKN